MLLTPTPKSKLRLLRDAVVFALILFWAGGISSQLVAQNTYYTFNGSSTTDWSDPLRWTTDPGGGGFPGAGIPAGGPGGGGGGGAATDRIIVRTGATVEVIFNNLQLAEIELQQGATLDLLDSDGHSLGTITGTGTIRLEPTATSGATEYEFPAGGWNSFLSATGGTVELSGGPGEVTLANLNANVNYFTNDDLSINSSTAFTNLTNFYTFNNLVLSGTGNKDFPINRFKFNGDVNITESATWNFLGNLRVRIFGDLVNSSNAPTGLNTPGLTAAADYDNISTNQFYLKGDLINQGNGGSQMIFTPKTGLSNATVNSVVVIFDDHFDNQALVCNGPINLEALVINKGSDQTYRLDITADAPNQFNLFGRTNTGAPNVDDWDTEKALALNSGTVSLGPNCYARLSTGGNYNVNVDARLLVNGGTAEQTGGPATVPYGTLQISNGGTMIANVGSGVTIRESGVILVEDGLLEARQIRTSVLGGALHLGAYIQTGGTTHLFGGGPGANRARFSLPYATNVFQMSGGTLRINSQNLVNQGGIHERGFDVRSNSANFAVTGGTVELVMDGDLTRRFAFNSTAPIFNLNIIGGGGRNVSLTASNNPSGGDFAPIQDQPLVVLNDFNIADNLNFFGEDNNITIGRNLVLGNTVTFDPGNQTTTFDQTNGATVLFQDPVFNYAINFDNLVVNKPSGSLTFESPGRTTNEFDPLSIFFTVNNQLRVEEGLLDHAAFRLVLDGHAFLGGDVGQIPTNGRLEINNGALHEIEVDFGSAPTIGYLEISGGSNVNLVGDDLGEMGTLEMPSASGIFNIAQFRLPIREEIIGGGWSVNKSIRVAGSFSDRGLGLFLDQDGSYFYPISTAANATARFTPVTATISGFPGASSGYLDFAVVDQEHPSLNTGAAPPNSALTFFFRARISGFGGTLPEAVYDFEYANSDEPGTPGSPLNTWVPGKIVGANRVDEAPVTDYDETANTILFNGPTNATFPVETGDYTAGDPLNFDGGVPVYYSRFASGSYSTTNVLPGQPNNACCGVGQAWNLNTTWSTDPVLRHNGPAAGDFPGPGDIVYIAENHRVYAGNQTTGDPFSGASTPIFASRLHLGGALFIRGDNALQNSEFQEILDTTGTGGLFLENDGNSPSAVPDADIGDYAANNGNDVVYRWVQTAADGTFDVPATYRTYPNLVFFGAGGQNTAELWDGQGTPGTERRYNLPTADLTINGFMNINTGVVVELDDGANGDLLIREDLILSSRNTNNNCGMLEFANSGTPRTVDVDGEVYARFANDPQEPTGVRVVPGGSPIIHTLRVAGDIRMNDQYTVLDFNETAKVRLILDGDQSASYERTNGGGTPNLPDFYQVIVDKSAGQADTFSFNGDFTIDLTLADQALPEDKHFVINRGIAHLNNPAIDLTLSTGGGDFEIPQEGGLQVSNGATARIDNPTGQESNLALIGSLRLDGTLGGALTDRSRVLLETVDANRSADLVYSPTASASIDVQGDAYLRIGGQLRRQAIPPVGGLSYTQGGTSLVQIGEEINAAQNNTFITTRGVFDHAGGAGSSFTMTGGTLQIMRPVPNASIAEVFLQADVFSMTGGTLLLGEAAYPAGLQNLTIDAAVGNEVFNLTIADAGGTAYTANMSVNPLVVNGDFNLLGNATSFQANNLDLSVRGNFLNEGNYITTTNTTTFDGATDQDVTLNSPTDFASLQVDNPGNTVNLVGTEAGSVVFQALLMTNGTFNLTDKRLELRGDVTIENNAEVTNTTGVLEFNNASSQVQRILGDGTGQFGNVEIDNPGNVLQDEDTRINGTLTFTTGRHIASFYELVLGPTANTVGQSATRYIQTDGTNASAGVTKIINTTGFYELPIGNVNRYGPATYDVTTLDNPGRLTVKPLTGAPSEYTDPGNLWGVNFHWAVSTDASLNIASGLTHTYQYNDADIQTPAQETNPLWDAGYIFAGANSWVRTGPANVNTTTNVATFTNNSTSNLEAIYAIGRDTELDAVREYWSRGNGVYSDVNNWSTVPWGDPNHLNPSTTAPIPPDPEVAPTGGAATVHINVGHRIEMDQNNTEAFNVELLGELDALDFVGARFRDVYGDGRMTMRPAGVNANLPDANWAQFVADGGTHEFAGNSNYTLPAPAQIVEYFNVELTGTGTRTVAVNNTRVLNNFTLNGPEFDLVNNRFHVAGDVTRLAGTIDGGTGVLELFGTTDQTVSGLFTQPANTFLHDLDLNKQGGEVLLGPATELEIEGELSWSRDALVQTSANGTLRFLQSATYSGAGANAYIDGPAQKIVFGGDEFIYPIGKNGNYRRARAFNIGATGTDTLEAEFYPATLLGSLPPNISDVEQNAHWRFEANTGTTARFNLFWDAPVATFDSPARVAKSDDPGSSAAILDMLGTAQVGQTNTTGDIKSDQSHTFASPIYVAVGFEVNPLPVEFLNFEGVLADGDADLEWTTAFEENTMVFEVQRSLDAQNFTSIGAVAAAGFSAERLDYDFTDTEVPNVETVYYRLRQVDFDGHSTFSNTIELHPQLPQGAADQQVYWRVGPNPTEGPGFRIFSLAPEANEARIAIISLDGRTLLSTEGNVAQLSSRVADKLSNLPQGIYHLRLQAVGTTQYFKIMKR